ncbi:hypothetical protein RJ640_004834 [Escallonia rubra]|uniref:Zinc ion binding protein n=1 Tax=Escallonia rubra TaxID=112253 RepID=A0AA88QIP4_9ASTE|nr:hypothetical protein RJ640_004834 [Escallonia rubra]
MNSGDLYKVWEVKALKKAGEDEARKLLERVAKQVQPIMRKRKWRVKLLSEFSPSNQKLLGLNVGAGVNIKLRLRRFNRDWDFLPFEEILDTMLHELCHNVRGPHDAIFYKLWDELREECDRLMSKGISGTGEGFDLPGRRLGGFSRQPPLSSLRQTILAAAEKRSCLRSLLPCGPKRLGGDGSIMAVLNPIQAAAMAAERRLQDNIWCGSESSELAEEAESTTNHLQKPVVHRGENTGSVNGFDTHTSDISRKRTREVDDSSLAQSSSGGIRHCMETKFIDLSGVTSVPGSMLRDDALFHKRSRQPDKKVSQSAQAAKSSFENLTSEASTSAGSFSSHEATDKKEESTKWECLTCTLLNPPLAMICELCGTRKPKDVAEKYKIWSCKFCTLENSVKLEKCQACGQWRYSHGPSVSDSVPNPST